MEFGFFIPARIDSAEVVVAGEAAGFTHAWLYDSPLLYGDVYVALALCAQRTSRIVLGPGVTVPSLRMPPVTAGAIATINALAPGRTVLGLGTGNTARRTMELPRVTWDETAEELRALNSLLRGRDATFAVDGKRGHARFIHQQEGFIQLAPRVPIYLSAFGPRGQELAGELADGVFLRGGVKAVQGALPHLERGAARAGRRLADLALAAMATIYIPEGNEGPDSDSVRSALVPLLLGSLRYQAWTVRDLSQLSPPYARAVAQYARLAETLPGTHAWHLDAFWGYLWGAGPDLAELVTPELIEASGALMTAERARAYVEELAGLGVRQLALQVAGDVPGYLQRFARQVIARV